MRFEVVKSIERVKFYDDSVPAYQRRYVDVQVNDFIQAVLRNGKVLSGYVSSLHEDYLTLCGCDECVFFWAVVSLEKIGGLF